MTYRSPADYRLRAFVWSALLAWSVAVWIAIIAFIAIPAAKAIVEAASNPAACAGYDRSDCAAVMGER
ncbi:MULTISPECIES: hypothetical protein [unclassified Paracoccus (in: a-proteobacteria)]|uniref:hypothetical protein n=1 Tax=unclassified Paracoccus (in: a-proteobacteria) TaxID=2688777 RepID=UPI0012B23EA6|nr:MULTISPECIES: hypothetical protein [unclassified Paracoccus (in: a-proteobacteria)]UXU73790.1 hypothetical protein GB879_007525 [Paracoccus sp. SMMA_5]UXU79680.1 hypothetical protein GB880_007515 [Paracoccus sp. SMMA_5_TC]